MIALGDGDQILQDLRGKLDLELGWDCDEADARSYEDLVSIQAFHKRLDYIISRNKRYRKLNDISKREKDLMRDRAILAATPSKFQRISLNKLMD